MIVLDNVYKSYGAIKVLENISLSADAGHSLCIVGKSGCGKSTLLKLVALITKPDGGKVIVDDTDVTVLKEGELEALRREKISYSFQEPLLIPYMSALENITEVIGVRKDSVVDVLSKLGLSDRINHTPSKLSVGERKRVDMARAMLKGSPILVADEPLSNLDPATASKVMELLARYTHDGGTLVYSSVEPSEAKFADSTIVM